MLLPLYTLSLCLLVVSGKYPTKQVVLGYPEAIIADQNDLKQKPIFVTSG